jgi:mevalonate kinase
VILFGEHAVVYGRPAIAVPVTNLQATASVTAIEPGSGVWLATPDLAAPIRGQGAQPYPMQRAPDDDPLRAAVTLALASFYTQPERGAAGRAPDILVSVTSSIPVARGLGSGAAVATAVVRAVARFCGKDPSSGQVSRLVFEVEKLHHGTPSGIDNRVIACRQPIYFVRDVETTRLPVGRPFQLVIADTGVVSSTRRVVDHVRQCRQADPQRYEQLFDRIGEIARRARSALEQGDLLAMGQLLDENHVLLVSLGVSSPELDRLVTAARAAGAMGAKLSGAGWGGNMLALVQPDQAARVAGALREAGAIQAMVTEVS